VIGRRCIPSGRRPVTSRSGPEGRSAGFSSPQSGPAPRDRSRSGRPRQRPPQPVPARRPRPSFKARSLERHVMSAPPARQAKPMARLPAAPRWSVEGDARPAQIGRRSMETPSPTVASRSTKRRGDPAAGLPSFPSPGRRFRLDTRRSARQIRGAKPGIAAIGPASRACPWRSAEPRHCWQPARNVLCVGQSGSFQRRPNDAPPVAMLSMASCRARKTLGWGPIRGATIKRVADRYRTPQV
jgi:hypothetical protein